MNPIPIDIPPSAEMVNHLYDTRNVEDLTQDIATIALENGCYVDVGWFPEHDPNGTYWIRVFWEYWDYQLRDPICVRDPFEAADMAGKLAFHFDRRQVPTSPSSTESTEPMCI